jgi:hypothetical protein
MQRRMIFLKPLDKRLYEYLNNQVALYSKRESVSQLFLKHGEPGISSRQADAYSHATHDNKK